VDACNRSDDDCDGSADNGPGMNCVMGAPPVTLSACGIPCDQDCVTCARACDCRLRRTTWDFPGDSDAFSHTDPPFGCPGAPRLLGTDWWWYTGPGSSACNLEVGPVGASTITLPPGDYEVKVWLTGNAHGSLHFWNASTGTELGTIQDFVLGPGGHGYRWSDEATSTGFNIVTYTARVNACIPVWVVVNVAGDNAGRNTIAIQSTHIRRSGDRVTSTDAGSPVICR
jgi:hypothetical protein